MKTTRLQGKWALITGSSRGIGQQIALGLAQCGCNIVVHGRTVEHAQKTLALLRAYPVKTAVVAGELGEQREVERLCQQVSEQVGGVDVLYNNAAIIGKYQPVWTTPLDEWLTLFRINVFSLVTTCAFFALKMRDNGFGRIINLSSGIKDQASLAPYSASKAAVDKFTRDLAAELKGTNVLVNCLDPGWLKTDLGSSAAPNEVDTVLPGALVPALLEDHGPSGHYYAAQDFKDLSL